MLFMTLLYGYCDGYTNVGTEKSSYGYILKNEARISIYSISEPHDYVSVPEIAYIALFEMVTKARQLDCKALHAFTSSQLVVHQMGGANQINSNQLRHWYSLIKKIDIKLVLTWIPARENREASNLSRRCLEQKVNNYSIRRTTRKTQRGVHRRV